MGRICLGGSVRIEAEGTTFEGEGLGRAGRLALAYLVENRHRPVSRHELAELCWGDELPRSWEQLVRGVVAKVRAAFDAVGLPPQEVLVTGFGGYRLHLPPEMVVDVEAAETHVANAVEALQADEPDVAAKEAGLALEIAAAGFLPGADGPWAETRSAELRELRLRALELASAAAAGLGDWDGARGRAEAALELEPYRESAHVALVSALAGGGRRVEALRAYERCRTVLGEELGLRPAAHAQAVYAAVLAQDGPPSTATGPPAPLPLPPALASVAGAGSFVGRREERAALEATLERARIGARQLVLVSGEAGIGKTRLIAEFAAAAHAAGARVLYGRVDEELGIPYAPVGDALAGYVATAPTAELAAHAARHGADIAHLVTAFGARLADLPGAIRHGEQVDRHRLLAAAADLVGSATVAAPVVLLLDDLHWSAAGGLLLLRHLISACAHLPLLIVGTHRDGEASAALVDLLAQLRREPGVVRLGLRGLDATDVAAYVAAERGSTEAIDATLARRVHEETAGHPFFVGELVRHLADEVRLGVPAGVVEVVKARLARRSPACQRALVQAAVTGTSFTFGLLTRLLPDDADAVLDALEEAVDAAFVAETDRPGHYRFSHAIVRAALYDDLSRARRARLHLAVGEALEGLDDEVSADRTAALAYHFCEAAPFCGGRRGADHALAAARSAMRQLAWEDAASLAELGLEALARDAEPDLERRYQLLMALAIARLRPSPDAHDDIAAAGLAAAEVASALGCPERRGYAALVCLSQYIVDCEDTRAARVHAREALAALPADAYGMRALLLAVMERPWDRLSSLTSSREAVRLARRSEDPVVLGRVLYEHCARLEGTPHVEERLHLADELVSLPLPADADVVPAKAGLRVRAAARLAAGDRHGYEADRSAYVRSLRELRTLRKDEQPFTQILLALLDGRFAAAEALLPGPEVVDPGSTCRRGVPAWGVISYQQRWAVLGREIGRTAEVIPALQTHRDRSPADRTVHAMLAQAHVEIGDVATAGDCLATVERLGLSDLPDRAYTLACLAEAAAGLPDAAWAERLLPLLREHAGQLVVGRLTSACQGAADRYVGQLAAAVGAWDEADARFRAAADLEGRVGAPPLVARTQAWHAAMLIRRGEDGDRQAAEDLLELVLEITDRLGMVPLHQQARGLLRGSTAGFGDLRSMKA